MQTNTVKVLSIVPGTRYMGIAIFDGTELRDWLVRSLRCPSLKEKLYSIREIMSSVINQYGINVLAIKKPHSSRSSKNLKSIVSHVREIGKSSNLVIEDFSIDQIKRFLLKAPSNKELLIKEVCTMYPFLFAECEKEKKNKNRYFTRMFEAVALGIVCFNHLDNRSQKVVRKRAK